MVVIVEAENNVIQQILDPRAQLIDFKTQTNIKQTKMCQNYYQVLDWPANLPL